MTRLWTDPVSTPDLQFTKETFSFAVILKLQRLFELLLNGFESGVRQWVGDNTCVLWDATFELYLASRSCLERQAQCSLLPANDAKREHSCFDDFGIRNCARM